MFFHVSHPMRSDGDQMGYNGKHDTDLHNVRE
jgi:hypothetical protein